MNRIVQPATISDEELVARAREGDSAAFSALVTRYQDRVFNTCYRMCGQHADAADLTQAAFLKALEHLPHFEARSGFFTWLFRIAVNLALTHRRSRKSRARLISEVRGRDGERDTIDSLAERMSDSRGGSPSEELERTETRCRLEAALEKLDDEFRAAVVLKDVEDLDYATIGQVLGVPVGTVKSRIHRGRMMLRELLLDEERVDGRV